MYRPFNKIMKDEFQYVYFKNVEKRTILKYEKKLFQVHLPTRIDLI